MEAEMAREADDLREVQVAILGQAQKGAMMGELMMDRNRKINIVSCLHKEEHRKRTPYISMPLRNIVIVAMAILLLVAMVAWVFL